MATVRAATAPSDGGRYIYAYCNIRTNQVLYSMKRSLKNSSVLKQLPDTGANNSPRALRKDLWQPLWRAAFPPGDSGVRQTMHAFKKLREWRKLHETNWEPPPQLSRPYSQKEIEELRKEQQAKGGSKSETVYDVIKRNKKKLRVKSVLDQKATSIADLAAVLTEQEELGVKTAEQLEKMRQTNRTREVRMFLELAAERKNGGLQVLDRRIRDAEATLARIDLPESEKETSKTKAKKELFAARAAKTKLQFAAEAVIKARVAVRAKAAREKAARERAAKAAREAAEKNGGVVEATPELDAAEEDVASTIDDTIALEPYLPSFPPPNPTTLPKVGPLAARIRRLARPVFTTDAVSVAWTNLLDAEYAPSWPESIVHEPMGFVRHTALHSAHSPKLSLQPSEESNTEDVEDSSPVVKEPKSRPQRRKTSIGLKMADRIINRFEAAKIHRRPSPAMAA